MAYDQIGVNLGELLTRWGLAQLDRKEREKERAADYEFRRRESDRERQQRREDLKYESSLRPPQESVAEEVGQDGTRQQVRRVWEPNFDKGGGQYRELSRMPVMAEPEGRPFEVVRGGNRVTIQRMSDGSEKELGSGPRWNPSERNGEGKSWARVEDPEAPGSWAWLDRNSGKYASDSDGRRVKADPPYRERERRGKEDEEGGQGGDKPPVPGARKAPDGNWYVQQDGKWFMVEP